MRLSAKLRAIRLFNISDGDDDNLIDVTLTNLTLRDGKSPTFGGAINAVENLTLDKITLDNNTTAEKGGAINFKNGNLIIKDSLLQNNTLTGTTDDARGAAIYANNGNVNIEDSSVITNEAELGAIAVDNADAVISNSSIMDNQGRGIIVTAGSLETTNSNISNNSNGGIFAEEDSSLAINSSSINNNQAAAGAGINLVDSTAELSTSLLIGNVATADGGAIKAAGDSDLTLTNTAIESNEAEVGSAIALTEDSTALLKDTSLKDNTDSDTELAGDNFTIETTPIAAPSEANFDLDNVHRFYQNIGGFHFYTADTNEVAVLREQGEAGTLPYSYEAEQFTVLGDDKDTVTGAVIEGAKPVYRFFNTATGAHLYTMDENESAFISDNLTNYNFEGINYYAFEVEPETIETIPVFRLLNGSTGTHLFTVDQNEVDFIKENLPQFSVEGVVG